MKFIVYFDGRGEWRWRLKARNGNIVADSGEGYASKGGAVTAVAKLRSNLKTRDIPVEVQK